jgi:hypothetical protein
MTVRKRELLESLLVAAVNDQIRDAAHRTRFRAETSGEPRSVAEGDVLVGRRVAETMLDWPLPGGKRLGDAVLGDVSAAKKFYLEQARGNSVKAQFLSLVEKAIEKTPRTPVGKVLTAAELKQAYRRAEKGSGAEPGRKPIRKGDGRRLAATA